MKKLSLVLILLVSFVSFTNSFSLPKNALIEYVTGTWCGNCPCGHQTLSTINSQYPQTIAIAYHAFSNDPYRNFNGNEIVSLLGLVSTPTADIDRKHFLGNSNYPLWISSAQNVYNASPDSKVDIAITSKFYNSNTRELIVNINSTAMENLTGQYKINVVITEDNLISPQNFYSNCGTPGYVNNYEHDNVARNMVNGATGENLNSGNVWNSNQTIPKNIVTTIDPQWNADNCKIVIFVYKEGTTLNQSEIHQAIQDNVTGTIGVSGNSSKMPEGYILYQNLPNPFNPSTVISYELPVSGNVNLKVYDINGREMASLVNGRQDAGKYSYEFNGGNLSTGVYFYRLVSNNYAKARRMLLLK
jgi:hypothetical protein